MWEHYALDGVWNDGGHLANWLWHCPTCKGGARNWRTPGDPPTGEVCPRCVAVLALIDHRHERAAADTPF